MSLQLLGVNQNNSTVLDYDGSNQQVNLYSAFGSGNNSTTATLPGYNGERQDPLTGVSHLGNGYRAYNPILMRFNCPDSESPFGVGGINPYAYCENDPVNFTDPSGHGILKWFIAGIASLLRHVLKDATAESVATVVGKTTKYTLTYGTQVASSITNYSAYLVGENNPQAVLRLEKASYYLGIIHTVSSLYSSLHKITKSMKHLVSRGMDHLWEAVNKPISRIDEAGNLKSAASHISEMINNVREEANPPRVEVAIEEVIEEGIGQEINIFSTADAEDHGLSNTKLIYQFVNATLGLTSTAFGIASAAVRKNNSQTAEDLSFISSAFGIAHFGLSAGSKAHIAYDKAKWGYNKANDFVDWIKFKKSISKLDSSSGA